MIVDHPSPPVLNKLLICSSGENKGRILKCLSESILSLIAFHLSHLVPESKRRAGKGQHGLRLFNIKPNKIIPNSSCISTNQNLTHHAQFVQSSKSSCINYISKPSKTTATESHAPKLSIIYFPKPNKEREIYSKSTKITVIKQDRDANEENELENEHQTIIGRNQN